MTMTNVIQTHHHTHSVVWWNAHDVHIDDKVLRASLEQARAGLGSLVRQPSAAHSAMRKAMSRRQRGLDAAWSWEEVGVSGDDLVIALAESSGDAAARTWSASVRLTITVSKATGAAMTSRPPIDSSGEHAAVAALLARYAVERAELTQNDVRTIALRCLLDDDKGRGVRIKESGSIYLLSAPHDEIVEAIKPAFAPAGLHLRTMPVYAESIAQLSGDVRAGILGEVDEVMSRIAKTAELVERGANARPSTLAARFEELDELRKKAQLFRMVLAAEADAVSGAIERARDAARETLAKLSGGKQ
jgi:hypothetical protein